MRDFALFVGWGGTYPGREPFALRHMADWEEILTRAKAEGEIEDFRPSSSGGCARRRAGWLHPRPRDAGEDLRSAEVGDGVVALRARAMLDHARFTVVPAIVGKGIEKQFSLYKEALAEYEREPALV